jgi:hypothetical protein
MKCPISLNPRGTNEKETRSFKEKQRNIDKREGKKKNRLLKTSV